MFEEPLGESVTGGFVAKRQCFNYDIVAVGATIFEVIPDRARVNFNTMFYKQLLRSQIPRAQKDRQVVYLFTLLGSTSAKAVRKNVDETDTWRRRKQTFSNPCSAAECNGVSPSSSFAFTSAPC